MPEERHDSGRGEPGCRAGDQSLQTRVGHVAEGVDRDLLGIHIALTPPAVYLFQLFGLEWWRGVFVVWAVYLFALLRVETMESET